MIKRTIAMSTVLSLLVASPAVTEDDHDHGVDEVHIEEEETGEDQGHDDHDLVRLTPAQLEEFGIEITTAGAGVIERRVELPGEVRPNADRLAHIVPRFAGIVTNVHARIGDTVKRGQVLAVIESDESLAPFDVKTLLSGTVIGKHIALGEAASRDRDAFVIADLSSVWIDLTVYQRDLTTIRVGQEARVYVGHDLVQDAGVISYVTPIVDEHTRTATARIVLSNDEHTWRPGMFVTADVTIERTDVPLVVPRTALHTFEGDTVVFIEGDEGFRPEPVSLGRHGETHVEVLSGLSVGDRFASDGGFTLKAELGKDSFGDGHGH